MTNQNCLYFNICQKWNCQWERHQLCGYYRQIESEQIDLAVKEAIDKHYGIEDLSFLAGFYHVPTKALEKRLVRLK